MKFVLGILLTALLAGALIIYLILMLNAHNMVYCGDVKNGAGATARVTRIYTTDLSANETLSEIVRVMNESESGAVSDEELTEILAQYQNIIYAPVFDITLTQTDTSTFILEGAVYNGITENDEPINSDYIYKNLGLTAAATNAEFLAAQNVYPEIESGEEGFIERRYTIDPIITDENRGAAFAFRDCDSFRVVFTATDDEKPPVITFVYTYGVEADNPLDFTGFDNGVMAYHLTIAYDENGNAYPELELERQYEAEEETSKTDKSDKSDKKSK